TWARDRVVLHDQRVAGGLPGGPAQRALVVAPRPEPVGVDEQLGVEVVDEALRGVEPVRVRHHRGSGHHHLTCKPSWGTRRQSTSSAEPCRKPLARRSASPWPTRLGPSRWSTSEGTVYQVRHPSLSR